MRGSDMRGSTVEESLAVQTPDVSPASIPSSAHVSKYPLCTCTSYSVLGSVMTTALDSDERLHSEVGLKQEGERTRQRTREAIEEW